jgi:hypothetical protein
LVNWPALSCATSETTLFPPPAPPLPADIAPVGADHSPSRRESK